ncbi:hypothetical protein [Microbulbifer sp.]|uniref:hypothetical protein n=1 Tax=Microbulbifer sp. TaxID=1908541 RepID=UPI003F2ED84F
MKMKVMIFFVLLYSPVFVCAENSPYAKISSVFIGTTGHAYIYVDEQLHFNPAGCSDDNSRYRMENSHPGFDASYSLILAAWMSGKDIRFNISDSECSGSIPKIRTVRVKN